MRARVRRLLTWLEREADPPTITAAEEEAEIEDDDSPHALALIPIERQIHDLLTEAGAEGLTISVRRLFPSPSAEPLLTLPSSRRRARRTSPTTSVPSPCARSIRYSPASPALNPSPPTSETSPCTS